MTTSHPTPTNTNSSTNNTQLAQLLTQELQTRHSLPVHPTWLTTFLSTIRHPPPPLPALASTAHFRLLHSDFTVSLQPSSFVSLPPSISSVTTPQMTLQTTIPVQVLDIVDVGSSRQSQVEGIERVERGEEIRGREVIRTVNLEDETNNNNNENTPAAVPDTAATAARKKTWSQGPHKLLLQDAAGTKVWGFEVVGVPRVGVTVVPEDGGLQVGAKMLLKKGVVVRRGLVLLDPVGVVVMGGKVEEWDRAWRAGRKARLLEEVKRENEEQQQHGQEGEDQ